MAYGHRGKKRTAPFSLRLTFEERAQIEADAGTMPVGAYISRGLYKESAAGDDAPKYRKRRSAPDVDQELLAQVLACLGATRIANNLNQLARATNIGSFYFDDDTKRMIREACNDVRIMRELLLRALGIADNNEAIPRQSPSQSFVRAAVRPRLRP
jgi:Bacterial mobilisation protein (MobC)